MTQSETAELEALRMLFDALKKYAAAELSDAEFREWVNALIRSHVDLS